MNNKTNTISNQLMRILCSVTIGFFISFSIYAQQGAGAYMDQVGANYNQISKDTWSYIKQASKGKNARKIEKRRMELTNSLKYAKDQAQRLKPYEGDAAYRDAVVQYLSLCYFSINNDYKKLVDMEAIAEESYDDMEAYLLTKERIELKMDSAKNALDFEVEAFAKRNNVRLIEKESKLSEKIGNANEVTAYYNKVFLIYYKSAWYEQEMVKAISEKRISEVEQFRQVLEINSKEGMAQLKAMAPFRNDPDLKDAGYSMLEFYYGEAVRYMPEQVAFFVKSDKMNTLQKNIESKKRKDLTQQEIDEYNKAVKDYNNSIGEYNKTNDYLNKYRTLRREKFDKAIDNLYSRHI